MAQKKVSVPFLVILISGLAAALVLGAIITRQIKNKDISSVETTTPTVTTTPQPTPSPAASSSETVIQPKVPKPTYPAGWKEYHNEKYRYTFAYPLFINNEEYKDNEWSVEADGNKTYIAAEGLDILGIIEVKEIGLEQAQDQVITYFKQLAIPREMILEKKVSFNGYEGTHLVFKSNNPDIEPESTILIQHEKKTYVLDGAGRTDSSQSEIDKTIEAVFSTFRFN